jgi:peptide deformylase
VATRKKAAVKIHPVVKYPDPVLAVPGEEITEFDDQLKQFVDEMFESMYAAQGIGLAAPQIAVSKRIAVIDLSVKKNPADRIALINPKIVVAEGKQFEEEGCLSLPEIREKVHRAARVKIQAQDVTGAWFEIEGEELLSRALQHEIDHLDGVLFIDRISRLKRELILRKIKKLQKAGEW